MLAWVIDQGRLLGSLKVPDKPPKFIKSGGECFWHCGTTRENIAIYRVKPFGGGKAMPTKQQRNQHVFTNLIPYKGREW